MRAIPNQSATGCIVVDPECLVQKLYVIKVTHKIVPRNPGVGPLPDSSTLV